MKKLKNESIKADPVKLVAPSNKSPKVTPLKDAIDKAKKMGGDLVEVNPNIEPPICKIILQKKEKKPVKFEELPLLIRKVICELEEENEPFRKVHRLIDAIEVFVKFHTVIVVSEYFNLENISKEMKGLLCDGLRTPSLGIWWAFARESNKELIKKDTQPPLKGIDKFLDKKGELFKALEHKDNLISFRNSYAHGATPRKEQCNTDLEKYLPRFRKLYSKAFHLRNLRLKLLKGELYLHKDDNTRLFLHPLLVKKNNLYYFYNDLKKNYASILNYEMCLHERSARLKEELLKKYPINIWKKNASDKFKGMVELLTEEFKGRKKELQQITKFLSQNKKGFLMIWGGPGVGKSALLARATQMLSWSEKVREQAGIKGEISADELYVIEYFIRRDMKTNSTSLFLDYLFARLQNKFRTGIRPGDSIEDKINAIDQSLKIISNKLKESERLVIIIDGLDEGAEVENLLEALPRLVPEKILVIYASREHPDVKSKIYDELDRENHEQFTIKGLTTAGTRALLHDYVNKYDLNQDYVKAVVNKSKGNPLYLKLLCEGLHKGDYKLNDRINLPEKMEEIYTKIMKRIAKTPYANDMIRLLAIARDYLSKEMMGEIIDISSEYEENSALETCMELLVENSSIENTYQIFHESLREYILNNKNIENRLFKLRNKITNWCLDWKDKRGISKKYALRYLIPHLKDNFELEDNENKSNILKLITTHLDNSLFRKQIFEKCGNAIPLQNGLRIAQKIMLHNKMNDSNRKKILEYSRLFHEEQEDMYKTQLEKLKNISENDDLKGIPEIAKMGTTAEDKFLLLLTALYNSPSTKHIPAEFDKIAEKWLKELNNPIFNKLWKKSIIQR